MPVPRSPRFLPGTLDFLQRFGLRVGYADPECRTLDIQARDISAQELIRVLREYEPAIETHLVCSRRRDLRVCVGGPFNGLRHNRFQEGDIINFHLGRARWAVYEVGVDGRAWYRGEATSKKKATRLRRFGLRGPSPGPETTKE